MIIREKILSDRYISDAMTKYLFMKKNQERQHHHRLTKIINGATAAFGR
jgi:hypothetical protein